MNSTVRKYLIERARLDNPVAYSQLASDCKLGLDLSLPADRHKLSQILKDISKYENENGKRPLLSAMAIYKDKNKDDQGNMFFQISEEMGFGAANQLKENLFGVQQQVACREYWRNRENYEKFFNENANIPTRTFATSLPLFFSPEDIDLLKFWGGKIYQKSDKEHVAAKTYIMESAGRKTVYWSTELLKRVPGLETINARMWSQPGWDLSSGKGIRVARFKDYTWARLFRSGDMNKDIFFTVGVDSKEGSLVYKLDYYFESRSNLSAEQKLIAEANIPKAIRRKSIFIGDFDKYNWKTLLDLSAEFIAKNLSAYDRLINLVWRDANVGQPVTNFLQQTDAPANGISELPPETPSFNGINKDFIQEAIEAKEIGDAGEELVKIFEQDRLRGLGQHDLADQVHFADDGNGYDVCSFDTNGNPIFIEVKTTTQNANTPFFLSRNEYLFAKDNPGSYIIHRVYNYDEDSNTAFFFMIDKPLEKLLFQPISYQVFYKGDI